MKRISIVIVLLGLSFVNKAQSFINPILSGFYPDPSICRAGDDYYITNSTFAYYPGLPIFHSKDLLNWQLIGHALTRPSQLNLDSAGVSRGLFAPAITYHNGTFYIVCTLVDKLGNFIVTTKDPAGEWSEPTPIPKVSGIDPSIFFDDNGRSYIVFNSIPPDNISLYDGHRTIRMVEFDAQNMKVSGEEKILINGGTDINKKPVWIEAPHLLKKDGWYYLLCAEGGTAYNHSEVVFRSRSVDGPFVSYEKNPILTQRQLDPKRVNPITTTGHADLVEAKDGKWWAVFLGCRPYEGDYYNTGRETFMAPVTWKDGWPLFDLGGEEVKYSYRIDATLDTKTEKFNGNYDFVDQFTTAALNKRYSFLRTVRENWWRTDLSKTSGAKLMVRLRPETISGTANPSFIGFRQPHLKGSAVTILGFNSSEENEKAGLLIFQNEYHYYYICKSVERGKPVLQLYKGPGNQNKTGAPELMVTTPVTKRNSKPLYLKIEADNDQYSFYYGWNGAKWYLLKSNVDGKFLSTKVAAGFVGAMYAMYATSNGKPSTAEAYFYSFECKSNDAVYKR